MRRKNGHCRSDGKTVERHPDHSIQIALPPRRCRQASLSATTPDPATSDGIREMLRVYNEARRSYSPLTMRSQEESSALSAPEGRSKEDREHSKHEPLPSLLTEHTSISVSRGALNSKDSEASFPVEPPVKRRFFEFDCPRNVLYEEERQFQRTLTSAQMSLQTAAILPPRMPQDLLSSAANNSASANSTSIVKDFDIRTAFPTTLAYMTTFGRSNPRHAPSVIIPHQAHDADFLALSPAALPAIIGAQEQRSHDKDECTSQAPQLSSKKIFSTSGGQRLSFDSETGLPLELVRFSKYHEDGSLRKMYLRRMSILKKRQLAVENAAAEETSVVQGVHFLVEVNIRRGATLSDAEAQELMAPHLHVMRATMRYPRPDAAFIELSNRGGKQRTECLKALDTLLFAANTGASSKIHFARLAESMEPRNDMQCESPRRLRAEDDMAEIDPRMMLKGRWEDFVLRPSNKRGDLPFYTFKSQKSKFEQQEEQLNRKEFLLRRHQAALHAEDAELSSESSSGNESGRPSAFGGAEGSSSDESMVEELMDIGLPRATEDRIELLTKKFDVKLPATKNHEEFAHDVHHELAKNCATCFFARPVYVCQTCGYLFCRSCFHFVHKDRPRGASVHFSSPLAKFMKKAAESRFQKALQEQREVQAQREVEEQAAFEEHQRRNQSAAFELLLDQLGKRAAGLDRKNFKKRQSIIGFSVSRLAALAERSRRPTGTPRPEGEDRSPSPDDDTPSLSTPTLSKPSLSRAASGIIAFDPSCAWDSDGEADEGGKGATKKKSLRRVATLVRGGSKETLPKVAKAVQGKEGSQKKVKKSEKGDRSPQVAAISRKPSEPPEVLWMKALMKPTKLALLISARSFIDPAIPPLESMDISDTIAEELRNYGYYVEVMTDDSPLKFLRPTVQNVHGALEAVQKATAGRKVSCIVVVLSRGFVGTVSGIGGKTPVVVLHDTVLGSLSDKNVVTPDGLVNSFTDKDGKSPLFLFDAWPMAAAPSAIDHPSVGFGAIMGRQGSSSQATTILYPKFNCSLLTYYFLRALNGRAALRTGSARVSRSALGRFLVLRLAQRYCRILVDGKESTAATLSQTSTAVAVVDSTPQQEEEFDDEKSDTQSVSPLPNEQAQARPSSPPLFVFKRAAVEVRRAKTEELKQRVRIHVCVLARHGEKVLPLSFSSNIYSWSRYCEQVIQRAIDGTRSRPESQKMKLLTVTPLFRSVVIEFPDTHSMFRDTTKKERLDKALWTALGETKRRSMEDRYCFFKNYLAGGYVEVNTTSRAYRALISILTDPESPVLTRLGAKPSSVSSFVICTFSGTARDFRRLHKLMCLQPFYSNFTITAVSSDDSTEEQHMAAVRIQSGWRGYACRRNLEQQDDIIQAEMRDRETIESGIRILLSNVASSYWIGKHEFLFSREWKERDRLLQWEYVAREDQIDIKRLELLQREVLLRRSFVSVEALVRLSYIETLSRNLMLSTYTDDFKFVMRLHNLWFRAEWMRYYAEMEEYRARLNLHSLARKFLPGVGKAPPLRKPPTDFDFASSMVSFPKEFRKLRAQMQTAFDSSDAVDRVVVAATSQAAAKQVVRSRFL